MDRELLSRLLTGMSTEINAPLTLFSAAAFPDSVNPQSTSDAVHWIPVEVYSNERQLVPPRFSRFCKVCREISMKHVTQQFYMTHPRQECPTLDTCIKSNEGRAPCRERHFDVNRCTNVQYQTYPRCECPRLDGDQCKGRDGRAPCREQEFDLNQCPEVLELRKKECVCYHSDISVIESLVEKWKKNAVLESGERRRCHAGFTEIAFPIEVHGHLLAVVMTGQVIHSKDDLVSTSELVKSCQIGPIKSEWLALASNICDIDEARFMLLGTELVAKQTSVQTVFLLEPEQLEQRIKDLRPNIERLRQAAESRYGNYRAKLETAFRSELLGYVTRQGARDDFISEHLPHVVARMGGFWGFNAVCLLRLRPHAQSSKLSCLGVIPTTANCQDLNTTLSGPTVSAAVDALPEVSTLHVCPYFYRRKDNIVEDLWLSPFLPAFRQVADQIDPSDDPRARRFLVCVPDLGDIYIYIFAGRMDATLSTLRSEQFPGVSDTCQDAIFEACTDLTHRLSSVLLAQTDRRRVRYAQVTIETAKKDFETLSDTVDQLETSLQHVQPATAGDGEGLEQAKSRVTEMKVLMPGAISPLEKAIARFREAGVLGGTATYIWRGEAGPAPKIQVKKGNGASPCVGRDSHLFLTGTGGTSP